MTRARRLSIGAAVAVVVVVAAYLVVSTLESVDVRYHVMATRRSQQLPLATKIRFRAPCP